MGMPSDGTTTAEQYEECVVARYGYEKACTSAYFDQTGTRILSTSYDDTIRGTHHRRRSSFSELIPFFIVWDDLDPTDFAALNEELAFEPSQLIHVRFRPQSLRYQT